MRALIYAIIVLIAGHQTAIAQSTSTRDPFATIQWTKECKASAQEQAPRLGLCDGVVFGVSVVSFNRDFCPPESFTVLQSMKISVKFMDDNPARLHEPLPILVLAALKEAWPCNARAPS